MDDAQSADDSLFAEYATRVQELTLFAETALAGIAFGQTAVRATEIIALGSKQGLVRPSIADGKTRAVSSQQLQEFAQGQAQHGFPLLFNLLTIRIWTLLEYLIDQLVLRALNDRQRLTDLKLLDAVDIPLGSFLAATIDEQNEIILHAIKQATKARLKVGVGRFEALLEAVGMSGPVPEAVRRAVLELSEVRNVLVRRDGTCEARIVERCPWLGFSVGQRIGVTSGQFERYRTIPGWYFIEVHRRCDAIDESAKAPAAQTLDSFERFISGVRDEPSNAGSQQPS